MADVETAIEQDAIADSLVNAPIVEPQETEAAGTEPQEVPQDEQFQEEAVETEPEENAEDWLPNEQDKVFTDDVLLRYAQRYQKDQQWLSDPLNRQLLIDKLNSDIYLRQQQELSQQEEFEVEQPEPEAPQVQPKVPTLDEHLTTLKQFSQRHTSPEMAMKFATGFMNAFGVKDPVTPELANALTENFSVFGLNLMQTALPQILAPVLDSVMPGFSDMYYRSARAGSWDAVRNSNEAFSSLPAYGSQEFMELCAKLDAEFPALTEMGRQLERTSGGQLHGPAAQQFYTTLAKLAVRQGADPQLLAQAAQAGARQARRGEVRRQAGNLGAGRSAGGNQQATSSKFQSNSDLFDDEALEIYRREHGRL